MPDFSLLGQPNFAGAALSGYQAGKAIGQQNEREGALKGYLANPEDPVGVARLAGAAPELGMPIMEQRRKTAEAARIGKLRAAAAAGDHAAAVQLYTDDPDFVSKLDERSQKQIKEGTDAIGNAALQIYTLPDDQIPAAADQVIDSLSARFPNLVQFKGHVKTRADLDAILAQTGHTKDALDLMAPKYQVAPPGGGLINTNPHSAGFDPNAGPGPAPVEPPVAAVDYLRKDPSLAQQFDQKYGAGAAQRVLQGGAGPATPRTFP